MGHMPDNGWVLLGRGSFILTAITFTIFSCIVQGESVPFTIAHDSAAGVYNIYGYVYIAGDRVRVIA